MAEPKNSRNHDERDVDALRDALRERARTDRARRQANAAALGDGVVVAVDAIIGRAVAAGRRPFATAGKPPRPARPKSWRGPHAGKKFRKGAELEAATREECAAGFKATWGYEMSDKDREVFLMTLDTGSFGIEQIARKAYQDLRSAIDRATRVAESTHNQTCGSATVALAFLWGRLPKLPPLAALPHYEKQFIRRRALVRVWQEYAHSILQRPLENRELAELSIVLKIGPGQTYASILRQRGRIEASVADVLDFEARRLRKLSK